MWCVRMDPGGSCVTFRPHDLLWNGFRGIASSFFPMKTHISSTFEMEQCVSRRLLWTFALLIRLSLLSEEIISLYCRVREKKRKSLKANPRNE